MKILHLTLKKKWFDMIASGEKKEEYREIKSYWIERLIAKGDPDKWDKKDKDGIQYQEFDVVKFTNGYGRDCPTVIVECNGIEVGNGIYEWGGGSRSFIIKLGNIISKNK